MGSTLQELLKNKAEKEERARLELVPAPVESAAPAELKPAIEKAAAVETKAPSDLRAASKMTVQPPQKTGATEPAAPTESEVASGYTSINNFVWDKVLRSLRPVEQSTLLRLLRLSHGFGKPFCKVSVPALASAVNTGQTQIRAALKTLEVAGYIERGAADYSNPNQKLRGTTYTVFLQMARSSKTAPFKSTAPFDSEPIKYKDLKESNLKRAPHLDVGKGAKSDAEIKPRSESELQTALAELREFAGDELLKDFERWYTPSDWAWIMGRIGGGG